MMARTEKRRAGDFIERLSTILIVGSFLGAFIVLLDFKLVLTIGGQVIQIGSGFAQETKGMVLQSMLITGFAAVVAFWYGTTKQGQDQAQSVNKIAEAASPAQAAAVAAATGAPSPPAQPGTIQAEAVKIDADHVTVDQQPKGTNP